MDKELALRLVAVIEKLYRENMALKMILKTNRAQLPPKSQLDEILRFADQDEAFVKTIHEQFAQVRARIQEDSTLEQVLQEFLQVVAPNKDVN